MLKLKKVSQVKNFLWETLRSPKTVSYLKLGAAIIGVVHAIDELRESSSKGPQRIGFRLKNDD